MLGEQYGLLISTAVSAGLVLIMYPYLLESIIFIGVIMMVVLHKLNKWAEKNEVDDYLNSFLASICAMIGIIYLTKTGLLVVLGFVYMILSIYMVNFAIEGAVKSGHTRKAVKRR